MAHELSPMFNGREQQPWEDGVYLASYHGTHKFEQLATYRRWDSNHQVWSQPGGTPQAAANQPLSAYRFLTWRGVGAKP